MHKPVTLVSISAFGPWRTLGAPADPFLSAHQGWYHATSRSFWGGNETA
jgi:hypothetical protein